VPALYHISLYDGVTAIIMTHNFEQRLGLLNLLSDGGEIQKAMQHRIKRSYGDPGRTQGTADTTSLPPTDPRPSISHEARLEKLFPTNGNASPVDDSGKDTSKSATSSSPTSDSAPSTNASETVHQPPSSIIMTSSATPQQPSSNRPFVGMPAPTNAIFCPLLAISKLPYKFIFDKNTGQSISVEFFAEGRFFRHGWTM